MSYDETWATISGTLFRVDLDTLSQAAHDAWLAEKKRRGVKSWPNERGMEQMVPWSELGEDVREFDRVVVRAIVGAMEDDLSDL